MVSIQGRRGADVLAYSESLKSVSFTSTSTEVWRDLGYWLDLHPRPLRRHDDGGRRLHGVGQGDRWPGSSSCSSRGGPGRHALAASALRRRAGGHRRRPRRRRPPHRPPLTAHGRAARRRRVGLGARAALEHPSRARPRARARARRRGPLDALGAGPASPGPAGRAAGARHRRGRCCWPSSTCRRSPTTAGRPGPRARRAAAGGVDRRRRRARCHADRLPRDAAARGRVRSLPLGLHRRSTPSRPDRQAARHAGSPAPRQRRRDGPPLRARRPLPGRRGRTRGGRPCRPAVRRRHHLAAGDAAFDRFRTPRPEITQAQLAAAAAATEGLGDARPLRAAGPQPARRTHGRRAVAVRSTCRPAGAASGAGAGRRPRGGHPGQGRRRGDRRQRRRGRGRRRGRAARRPRAGPLRASLGGRELAAALQDADQVLITDSNRDRAHHWRGSQDVTGFTESGRPRIADVLVSTRATSACPSSRTTPPGPRPSPSRRARSRATASSYGEPFAYRPEDRPFMAVDGDPTTAWLVADRAPAEGQRIRLEVAEPIDHVTLRQPQGAGAVRHLGAVTITVDGRAPEHVTLDERSLSADGQRVDLDPTSGCLDGDDHHRRCGRAGPQRSARRPPRSASPRSTSGSGRPSRSSAPRSS